jgi:hypothetical protein
VHTAYQDKDTYVLEDFDSSIFKYTTAGNNLKPFRIRTAYINTDIINGQGTTTLLGGDETDDDETN